MAVKPVAMPQLAWTDQDEEMSAETPQQKSLRSLASPFVPKDGDPAMPIDEATRKEYLHRIAVGSTGDNVHHTPETQKTVNMVNSVLSLPNTDSPVKRSLCSDLLEAHVRHKRSVPDSSNSGPIPQESSEKKPAPARNKRARGMWTSEAVTAGTFDTVGKALDSLGPDTRSLTGRPDGVVERGCSNCGVMYRVVPEKGHYVVRQHGQHTHTQRTWLQVYQQPSSKKPHGLPPRIKELVNELWEKNAKLGKHIPRPKSFTRDFFTLHENDFAILRDRVARNVLENQIFNHLKALRKSTTSVISQPVTHTQDAM